MTKYCIYFESTGTKTPWQIGYRVWERKKKKQESRMIPIFWLSNNGRIELPTTKMGKAAGGEG